MDMELRNLRAQVTQLQERVDGMETERQSLYRQMETLESQVQSVQRNSDERVAAVERSVRVLDEARVRDREEIVSTISGRVAELVKPPPAPQHAMTGVEHTVKPGETLSAIAAAYGVRTSVIAELNNIKDPNTVRVGQKLFIPE